MQKKITWIFTSFFFFTFVPIYHIKVDQYATPPLTSCLSFSEEPADKWVTFWETVRAFIRLKVQTNWSLLDEVWGESQGGFFFSSGKSNKSCMPAARVWLRCADRLCRTAAICFEHEAAGRAARIYGVYSGWKQRSRTLINNYEVDPTWSSNMFCFFFGEGQRRPHGLWRRDPAIVQREKKTHKQNASPGCSLKEVKYFFPELNWYFNKYRLFMLSLNKGRYGFNYIHQKGFWRKHQLWLFFFSKI